MTWLAMLAASAFCGQLTDELYHDFRKGPLEQPWAVPWGAHASEYMRMDLGLRITLPPERRPLSPVGLLVQRSLKGDFEVAGGFAIIDVPEPPNRPGAGVSMYFEFDTEPKVYGTMSWLNGPGNNTRYSGEVLWNRPGAKPRSSFRMMPTKASSGRLHLRRIGD